MESELEQEEYDGIEQLVAKRKNSALHTKAAYFKMEKWYNYLGSALDIVIIVLTVGLAFNLVADFAPAINFYLAAFAAIVSFLSLYFQFDKKTIRSKNAGEDYLQLAKEYERLYHRVLPDGSISPEEKKHQVEQLTTRHQELNQQTFSTEDWAYSRVDSDDVLKNSETTDEEKELLLNH